MRFCRLLNKRDVIEILTEPSILERAAQGIRAEEINPQIDEWNAWWTIEDGGEIIGLFLLEQFNDNSVFFHPYLRKQERHKCHKMINEFFVWFLDGMPRRLVKIIVVIPSLYRQVYNFAIKAGFKAHGLITESYILNNKVYDQWILGLTRNEIEDIVNGFNS